MDRKRYLDEIRRLETIVQEQGATIVEKDDQLTIQAAEIQGMTRASMEVRSEDVEQLAAYKEQNMKFIIFIEEIAGSKSKFAKEARHLLGI